MIHAIDDNGDVKLRLILADGSAHHKVINCPFASFTETYQMRPGDTARLERCKAWPAFDVVKSDVMRIYEGESVAKMGMIEMYKSIPQPIISIAERPHKGVFVRANYETHSLVLPFFGTVFLSSSKKEVARNAHAIQNLAIDDHVFFIAMKLHQHESHYGIVPAANVAHTEDEDEVNLEIVYKSAYSYKSNSKTLTPAIPCFVNTRPLNAGDEVKFLKTNAATLQSKGTKRVVERSEDSADKKICI